MTSGKPLLYPEIYYVFEIMRQIGRACPKEAVSAGTTTARARRAAMGNGDAARAGSPICCAGSAGVAANVLPFQKSETALRLGNHHSVASQSCPHPKAMDRRPSRQRTGERV